MNCPICLRRLRKLDTVTLSCKHTFHKQCIRRWSSKYSNELHRRILKTEESTCPICRKNVSKNVIDNYKYNVKENWYEKEKELVRSTINVIIKDKKFRTLIESYSDSNELHGLNYWMSNAKDFPYVPKILKENGEVNMKYVLDICPYLENGKLKKRWVRNVFIPVCHVMIKTILVTYDSASEYKSKYTKEFINNVLKYYKYSLELSLVSGFITEIKNVDVKVNMYLIEYIVNVLGGRHINGLMSNGKFDREIVKIHDKMIREGYNYWVNDRIHNKRKGLHYVFS